MGLERGRAVEVHSRSSVSGRLGSGYLVSDRLVLTAKGVAGRGGRTDVRRAGTGSWVSATVAWAATCADAALLELDAPFHLNGSSPVLRWGHVTGPGSLAVTAVGFPEAEGRPEWVRDPEQMMATLSPVGPHALAVTPIVGRRFPAGDGMSGAALFAGPDLVGVLLVHSGSTARMRGVPVALLADDPGFVELVGTEEGLTLTPIRPPTAGFPILPTP